ncbi:AraC family transcriptional regulator ligand-binding domain-containing protein [Nocardia yunnanensis]|nr:AraC family transcriptional regulator ligand-binding domain-containing protein [Nocardia yunnanensis]
MNGAGASGSDSVLLARFVLRRGRTAGLDPRELARAAGVGAGVLAESAGSVPGLCYLRLWELLEQRTGQPHVGLRAAERHAKGELGMIDYLVATAGTVGEGLRAATEFGAQLTRSRRLDVACESESCTTFVTGSVADGRGAELAAQATFAFLTSRVRFAAAAPIVPARITFRQRAPRHHAPFVEFFGTAAIDFGADTDSMTLHRADMDRPQHSADARLAGVLRRGAAAATLSSPPARAWADLVAAELDSPRWGVRSAATRPPTLEDAAARLGTSPRTLQRRLAAAGTSWSRELANARTRTAG